LARQRHLKQTWTDIQYRLRTTLHDSTYEIWLADLEPLLVEESALYVQVPKNTGDWIRRRFGASLTTAARATDPSINRIELVEPGETNLTERSTNPHIDRATFSKPRSDVWPGRSFDRFVIGESNRFAHAAALTVAENPGHAYNPLFIYGAAGTGKTHLLEAIGSYMAMHDRGVSVHYTTAETFTSDFMRALRHKELEAFKRVYRENDVLLVDDIQFLEGKPKTAEELVHTLNVLASTGAQLVVSSDRHPSKTGSDAAQLVKRLEAGLVAELMQPNLETRIAILQKLATYKQTAIEVEVLEYIAKRVESSVRALEGALVRVSAFASLTDTPIDIQVTKQVLDSLYHPPDPLHSRNLNTAARVDQIQAAAAAEFGLVVDDLCSSRRNRLVVYARQIAMYLTRELTDLSLPAIAQRFGGKDHTTVLHAHKKITAELLANSDTRSLITNLTERIHRSSTDASQA
jgi:chromosomal replication initiator protein